MTLTQYFALIAAAAMIIGLFIDPLYDLCTYIYHKICDIFGICYHPYGQKIKFIEQYLDKDGNEFNTDDLTSEGIHKYIKHIKVHHTYRIYYCPKCGKIFRKEQLQ